MCLVEPRRVKNICEYNNLFFYVNNIFRCVSNGQNIKVILQAKETLISPTKKRENTNLLELIAVKFPIKIFAKGTPVKTIH